MRPEVILREAWRNIHTGTSKAGWLSVGLIVLILVLSCAELVTVSALDKRAREYHSAAASVRVLKADSGVNPQQCEALSRSGGILSAGAIRSVPPLMVTSLPGIATPAFETTLEFQRVLGVDTALTAGVLVSEPLARRWNIREGDILETDQGSVSVAAVFPYPESDGRDSRLANALLLPTLPTGFFDECWVDVWPSTAGYDSLIRSAQSNGPGEAAAPITTLNPTLGLVFAGAEEYQNRLTRLCPAVSVAMGTALGALGGTRRRLEYASSIHAGVSNGDLTLIALVEATIWAGIAGLVATAGMVLGARLGAPMVADALHGEFVLIGGLGILGTLTETMTVTAMARESRLFRYFRERN